jgi:hypothetical protein
MFINNIYQWVQYNYDRYKLKLNKHLRTNLCGEKLNGNKENSYNPDAIHEPPNFANFLYVYVSQNKQTKYSM